MENRRKVRPAIGGREDLERPGALQRAVAELGALAAAHDPAALGRLGDLASPDVLDLLFRIALGRSLRCGPGGADELGSPARWLDLAATAAASGLLPLATVEALRSTLDTLARELLSSGTWDEAAPLWWSPLPSPGGLEELWRRVVSGAVGLPSEEAARAAFASPEPEPPPRWLAWPDALPPELLERVAGELAAATAEGGLSLEGAGVGRSDRRSPRRNDEVRYLTGLEPEVSGRLPTLGALVQHLLEHVEEPLRRVLPGVEVHAPQTAMLARYRASSPGFAAHLDNPGGDDDNGRVLSLILYLNRPDRPCRGGGLALWPAGASVQEPPAAVLAPAGGSAVLFDARTVAHAVEPLTPGPDRWTLVLWLSARPRRPPRPLLPVPAVTVSEAILPVDDPPLARGAVLFRRLGRDGAASVEVQRPAPGRRPRAGVVATVRGAGARLEAWCRHHLELGFDHLLLVLDEGAGDEEVAGVEDLRRTLGRERLSVWTDGEARRRRRELPRFEGHDELAAAAAHGTATWAVAARQALNATAAVRAAAAREESDFGAAALDWLVHLDADELLHLEGPGAGGASVTEHFAAAEAAGWPALRYLDHELLLPWRPGEAPRFKRNPALAALRLGSVGWRRLARLLAMEQGDRRPYFRAYWNGKSAVAVAPGVRAAGVHGWHVPGAPDDPLLAGPSVLHFHLPTAESFRRKYLLASEAPAGTGEPARPFPPSTLERAAISLVHELRTAGAAAETVAARLDALYAETTQFAPDEVDLLEEAGLLFTPRLSYLLLPKPAVPAGRR